MNSHEIISKIEQQIEYLQRFEKDLRRTCDDLKKMAEEIDQSLGL